MESEKPIVTAIDPVLARKLTNAAGVLAFEDHAKATLYRVVYLDPGDNPPAKTAFDNHYERINCMFGILLLMSIWRGSLLLTPAEIGEARLPIKNGALRVNINSLATAQHHTDKRIASHASYVARVRKVVGAATAFELVAKEKKRQNLAPLIGTPKLDGLMDAILAPQGEV